MVAEVAGTRRPLDDAGGLQFFGRSFVKDETRGAFIDGYKITLSGAMKSEVKDFSFSKEYTNLDEATAYTFTFDLTNVGGASLSISFNNTTETVDLGDIELNN